MGFFWSNPYQTELVITSLIEMLELTKLWSHDHIYNMIGLTKKNIFGDVMDRNYDVNISYFKKA